MFHRTGVGRWIVITHWIALCILSYKGSCWPTTKRATCAVGSQSCLLVGMLSFRRSYWARLAQKLRNHLRCWFLWITLSSLVHTVVQVGPAGPQRREPLAIYYTTSLWKGSPAQPEPPDGDRLVEVILDKEPTVCQVPGSALDSQLMEGITYSEVSLDSRPMEGSSCQEQVQQSFLLSSCTVSPCNCVTWYSAWLWHYSLSCWRF